MGDLKNVLLTGGNGFLGSFILKQLIKEGIKPILLLRPNSSTWRINDLLNQCIVIRFDHTQDSIFDIYESFNIEVIIHTATDYGRESELSDIFKTNVLFPLRLIEEGIKRSLSLFINTDTFFAKSGFDQTYLKKYTFSKRVLEHTLKNGDLNLKIVNLRIEHIYGENDSDEKFFAQIIKKLLNRDKEILLTNGLQKRDFIYVNDVASAYIKVIKNFHFLKDYQEYEVGTGKSINIKEFVLKLAKITNSKSILNFGALPSRQGDIEDSFANIAEIKKLGWAQEQDMDAYLNQIIKNEKKRLQL